MKVSVNGNSVAEEDLSDLWVITGKELGLICF